MELKVDILKPSGRWYANEIITIPNNIQDFDVFLCHNSEDKAEVKKIGEQLLGRGVSPSWCAVVLAKERKRIVSVPQRSASNL